MSRESNHQGPSTGHGRHCSHKHQPASAQPAVSLELKEQARHGCPTLSRGEGDQGGSPNEQLPQAPLPNEPTLPTQHSALSTQHFFHRLWEWLCLLIFRNRFAIAIASLVWLIWRSGTQPRRLAYPCQQAASANLGALAVLFVPALARRRHDQFGRLNRAVPLAAGSVVLAGCLFMLINAGITVYSNATDTYTPGNPAVVIWTPVNTAAPANLSSRIFTPTGAEAVVAVERNPNVTYGVEPYGPGTNTAYDLVWKAVADLNLGTYDNPLKDLVQDVDGDGVVEVLIKPNTVEHYADQDGQRCPTYGHPAMIRPLVDMAAKAGAKQIRVGDGSDASGNLFTSRWDKMGYTQNYFNAMSALWPGVTISRVDFANRNKWSWVNLGAQAGGASAYVGGGYTSSQLAKYSGPSQYFTTPDPHGRPGPGAANCMGWLALTDYLLDADVIVDLAKLKVHYLGVNTAVLKNWVGITMFSTFDGNNQYACRVAHNRSGAEGYPQQFGNDILWREMVDAHRAVLYWRNGTVHTMPQRRYLCIMDAINAGERYHAPNPALPYWLKTVMASVDPVSIDAVGSRLQRYNFRRIPIVNNAHALSVNSPWPLGTADPAQVRVVGSTPVDASFNHLFQFERTYDSNLTWPDWNQLTINDVTPPAVTAAGIRNLGNGQWSIEATITGAHAAFVYYGDDGSGAPKVVRLGRNGDSYAATVNETPTNPRGSAQDEYFNTTSFIFTNVPLIGLSTHTLDRSIFVGESLPSEAIQIWNMGAETLNYSVATNCNWMHVTATDNSSTGEADPVQITYDTAGLPPGVYTCTITATGNALNSPQTVTVTLTVTTVKPDFDHDGDVDMSDFGHLQACLSGAGNPPATPACNDAAIDNDNDVDWQEVGIFRRCLSGEGILATKGCDAIQ